MTRKNRTTTGTGRVVGRMTGERKQPTRRGTSFTKPEIDRLAEVMQSDYKGADPISIRLRQKLERMQKSFE